MFTISLLDPANDVLLEKFRPFLPQGFTVATAASRSRDDQIAAIGACDFAITGDVPVDRAMMQAGAAGRLRAVHKWGVGFDNIDLETARASGIRVMRTAGSNAVPVAETALSMILSLHRNVVRGHDALAQGRWAKAELREDSSTLSGKTVGIVGFGHIGQTLARLLRGFGCEILYTQRTALPAQAEAALGARHVPLDTLLAQADVVSLHCPLTEATENLFDAQTLGRMKPGSYLVNLARGGVVVEHDLVDAVRSGHLRGAGCDVYAIEPLPADSPLLQNERIICTPHLAAVASNLFPTTVSRMLANFDALTRGVSPVAGDVLV